MIKSLIISGFLLIITSLVHAHKVNILANIEGSSISTQVYLSDGKPVKNCFIEVYDPNSKKLVEGKTDQNGEFSFEIPVKTDLRIVADASMGHLVETVVKASDLPDIKIANKNITKDPTSPTSAADKTTIDENELRVLLSEVIDEKLHPIENRLSRLEKKTISATEIIGGIGYIFGLMGLLMYFRSRRAK